MKPRHGCRWVAGILLLFCASAQADCVILLHGLARGDGSMRELESSLEGAGYTTVNHQYPSMSRSIPELASDEIPEALDACPSGGRVHFVTHSLGGIIVRQYLDGHDLDRLGRVVMLGPPNHGSEVVDTMRGVPGFGWIAGPAAQQLGTGPSSIPNLLGPAGFELGIIAGERTINPVFSLMVPNPDDGSVSVESTRLEGMSDHIVLPVNHFFMPGDDRVIEQTLYFLENGRFRRQ